MKILTNSSVRQLRAPFTTDGSHVTSRPAVFTHWVLPDRRKSYYDESYLPKKLDRVDEAGNLYFDGGIFPWKLADDFAEDKRWGYPKWKVALGKLTGKGKKGD